jgi:hypothetical protein
LRIGLNVLGVIHSVCNLLGFIIHFGQRKMP